VNFQFLSPTATDPDAADRREAQPYDSPVEFNSRPLEVEPDPLSG
jgi:hypothetical protein